MIENKKTILSIINKLENFWNINLGCVKINSYDIEVGAGTSHPLIFFNAIKLNSMNYIYIQKSRRPQDCKFNKTKLYSHIQFQVILNPIPENIQELYIKSLSKIGIDLNKNNIKFIDDNWNNPTLASWGVGNEVQLNCIEITQFTYFICIGGIKCIPNILEITYGIERLSMIIQNVLNINNLIWDINKNKIFFYKDIFFENSIDYKIYNSKYINSKNIYKIISILENEINYLLDLKYPLIIPAYDCLLKIINNFNILDSRNELSLFNRQIYIIKIQNLSKKLAKKYLEKK